MSLESIRDLEFQKVYPSLELDSDSINSTDSRLDSFNELENLFNELTAVHTLYIETKAKESGEKSTDEIERLGQSLINLESELREKIKTITNSQFEKTEQELNEKYVNCIKAFEEFGKSTYFTKCNLNTGEKNKFHDNLTELTEVINELETFREQKLLPDQFRILRSTATGVRSKLSIEISNLKKEIDKQKSSIDKAVKYKTDYLTAQVDALSTTKKNLLSELESVTKENHILTQHKFDLSFEVDNLKRQIDNLNEQLEENTQTNNSLENSIAETNGNFESEIKRKESKIRLLEETINEKDSLLENTRLNETKLKDTVVRNNQDYTVKLNSVKQQYEHTIELLKKDKSNLEDKISKYSELVSVISEGFNKNSTDFKELYDDFDEKQTNLNNLYTSSIDTIKELIDHIQQELADSKNIIIETSSKVNQLQQSQSSNKTLLGDLNEVEVDDDQTDSLVYDDSIYTARHVVQNQEEREEVIKQFEETISGLGARVEQLGTELQEKILELQNSREHIVALNQQLNNLDLPDFDFVMNNNNLDILTRNLGELFSREEKKTIPMFSGQTDGKSIHDFLKIAKRLKDNNTWDDQQLVRFISDRLCDEALDWHLDFMRNLPLNEASHRPATDNEREVPAVPYTRDDLPFQVWEEAFLTRFTNLAHKEKLRNKLYLLRQTSDQDIQSFISSINNLYKLVNGEGVKLAPNNFTQAEKRLAIENQNLRDQEKLKILLKGVLPKIRNVMWSRMSPSPTYEEACATALDAESILINQEISEDRGLTAVVAGMSVHEEEQDRELKKQKSEIELLKSHLSALNLSNNLSQGMEGSPKLVAAVSEERPSSRIRFNRSPSSSKEQRSGSEGRYKNEHQSRSPSPYQPRYNKDHRERPKYSNNYNNDKRRSYSNSSRFEGRSQSNSRNNSLERGHQVYKNQRFRSTERRPYYNNRKTSYDQRQKPQLTSNRGDYQNKLNPRFTQQDSFRPIIKSGVDKQRAVCYFCNKPGHQVKECRLKMRNQRGERRPYNN